MASRGCERALAAAIVVFFVTGATYAAWATRIPAVQDRLDLSPGALAVAIVGLEAGAIAGLPAGAALVSRIGSPASLRLERPVLSRLHAGHPLGLVAGGVGGPADGGSGLRRSVRR